MIPIAEAFHPPATRDTRTRRYYFGLRIHRFGGVAPTSRLYDRLKKTLPCRPISGLSRDSQICWLNLGVSLINTKGLGRQGNVFQNQNIPVMNEESRSATPVERNFPVMKKSQRPYHSYSPESLVLPTVHFSAPLAKA
jgi:hypothetical protein